MARTGGTVREGLVVGAIGYAVVAVFFTFFDLLAGRGTTFTLNLLGKMVFRGVRDPAVLQLPIAHDMTAMVGYNFLHLFVSLAVGIFVAALVTRVDDTPRLGVPVLLVLVAGYMITVAAVALLSGDVAELLPRWTIVTVNTLAAVGGGLYLLRAHPGLLGRLLGRSD